MSQAQLDYRALAALDAVVAEGSFDKAALRLGISQSAVSQRIKALEDAAGRLLVVRGSPAVATGLGQRLITHFRQVQMMEAALDIDLGRAASRPDVCVAVDADSLATWFGQALPPLLQPPRCQLEVQVAASEPALRLVREGAAFGCVAGAEAAQAEGAHGTTTAPLGTLRYLCVATPAFAARWFGDGMLAEALELAPAAQQDPDLLARFLAQALGFAGRFPRHTLPNALPCIEQGVAYGLQPELAVRGALAGGRLLDLLPGHALALPLVWRAWNVDTPFMHTLSEQVVATARRLLAQP